MDDNKLAVIDSALWFRRAIIAKILAGIYINLDRPADAQTHTVRAVYFIAKGLAALASTRTQNA